VFRAVRRGLRAGGVMVVNAPLVTSYDPAKLVFKDRVYAEEAPGITADNPTVFDVHVHERNHGPSHTAGILSRGTQR
jgi:hypothetical protein